MPNIDTFCLIKKNGAYHINASSNLPFVTIAITFLLGKKKGVIYNFRELGKLATAEEISKSCFHATTY
jgi:hypothetical protein